MSPLRLLFLPGLRMVQLLELLPYREEPSTHSFVGMFVGNCRTYL